MLYFFLSLPASIDLHLAQCQRVVIKSGPGNVLASAVRKCCRDGDLLLVADNGKYVSRETTEYDDYDDDDDDYEFERGFRREVITIQSIQALKSTPDESCHFKVKNTNDGTILLQGDDGNYLCRVEGELNSRSIEASKSTPERSCHLTVHNQPDGTVAFQEDNGKVLSRIYYIGGGHYIEAAKSQIDVICKFCLVQE